MQSDLAGIETLPIFAGASHGDATSHAANARHRAGPTDPDSRRRQCQVSISDAPSLPPTHRGLLLTRFFPDLRRR